MGYKIGLAGDWHGNNTWARHAIATYKSHGITDVFQLGDFGLGWPGHGSQMLSDVIQACQRWGVNLYIVPGNHENWRWINRLKFDESKVARLSNQVYVLGRGFRGELPEDRTLVALGGAPSIDFQSRTEGRDWWAAEMITLPEAEEVAAAGHADIMLTHDAPYGGTDIVQGIIDHNPQGWPEKAIKYATEGRHMMNVAYDGVKPKVLAHGHYHVDDVKQTEDTLFISVNMDRTERNLATLDLETLEVDWLDILLEIPK